jgi:hypothetical protein
MLGALQPASIRCLRPGASVRRTVAHPPIGHDEGTTTESTIARDVQLPSDLHRQVPALVADARNLRGAGGATRGAGVGNGFSEFGNDLRASGSVRSCPTHKSLFGWHRASHCLARRYSFISAGSVGTRAATSARNSSSSLRSKTHDVQLFRDPYADVVVARRGGSRGSVAEQPVVGVVPRGGVG